MKNVRYIVALSAIIFLTCLVGVWAESGSSQPLGQKAEDLVLYAGNFSYIIGPGDVLEIRVWRHPDLDNRSVVRPDGRISFPLIGDMPACDLTPEQLKDKIALGLSHIINDPRVTVNVTSFQSKKIFVLGEVYRPGVYPFEGRVNVLDAISRAQGYKEDTAVLKSVVIIRGGSTNKPQAIRVNLWNVINKADISQNILLEAGDIVFVPKSFIAKLDTFIEQFFTKTDPILQYYLDIYNIREPGILSR